ncbi:MAG: LacI family DNA-binding transcriptional regulator [Candidatus Faecousia sp.]|nr:LacI family transcriptional regulator [Clostridiales bacterium]MCI6935618.1 LacI family transcriptional regulator [Clostridiales bacterium]MDD5883257.1 LacI family DNA-binding transcriptional regulator [Bacillota bacterium]MDY4598845.1 LacI family DNA-binding transcriptional regulator [Candidatus Faecousia sp.]
MVSMKDIARSCGVSVATVSKALNGQPDIGEETRARVCEMAQKMGYMTNSAARALKTNRTYHLGVLFVDERQSGLGHEYFSTMLESFKAEAESHGYDITFINHNVGGKPTSYLQHCRYRGVDGVVIACVAFADPQVRELAESELPLVTVDHVFNNRLAVMSDNVQGMEALVHYAYEKGHRKIAFLHGEKTTVTQNRLVGFYRACEELGLEIPEEYVRESVFHDPDRCALDTQALMSLPERPTCILFPDDYSYVGGMNTLRQMGIRVPEDVSVMGYDGIHLAQVLGLTTYWQDTRQIGKIAAERLISLIEHPKTTLIDRIMVSGKLLEGTTVRQLD